MGLFGKSKKERETEYMSRLDVPSCLKEDFELIIDDIFTIMGVGTVATGNILTGMCREGENACIYKANGDILETRITTVDVHTKERKANGFGQTKDMPYGIYTVHQTSGWEGREMMDDFDVFISQNAQTYRYLINNRNFESFVNVVKVDAESGKSIPYAGAGFKIYDPQGNQVKMTFTYPTPTTIDVFYTDANGSLVTPEKLDYGKGYSIVEVQAPYGYVLDDTPVYFDITEENSTEEGGVTVVKVNKPNMAQKGTITVEKTGEVFSGVNVSGSEDSDVIYQPVYEVAGLEGAVYSTPLTSALFFPSSISASFETNGRMFL